MLFCLSVRQSVRLSHFSLNISFNFPFSFYEIHFENIIFCSRILNFHLKKTTENAWDYSEDLPPSMHRSTSFNQPGGIFNKVMRGSSRANKSRRCRLLIQLFNGCLKGKDIRRIWLRIIHIRGEQTISRVHLIEFAGRNVNVCSSMKLTIASTIQISIGLLIFISSLIYTQWNINIRFE